MAVLKKWRNEVESALRRWAALFFHAWEPLSKGVRPKSLTLPQGKGITGCDGCFVRHVKAKLANDASWTGAVMKFTVIVHPVQDGIWTVECPSIPGCVSRGSTKEEALKNISRAIARCLQERADQELPTSIEPSVLEPKD